MAIENPSQFLKDIFGSALEAVDPYRAVARHVEEVRETYKKGHFKTLYVIGLGKAVSAMTRALTDYLGDLVTGGIAVTKYGHSKEEDGAGLIRIYEAGHPLPDESGAKATQEIIQLARGLDDRTMVLCFISGGGSALLVAPVEGISLQEKQSTTDLLLRAGADINELNMVRKHISAVKGGRFAELAYPAVIRSLILSDVIDDRLDVIASGPTAPDPTTYADALDVIKKYGLEVALPPSVVGRLADGANGRVPDTPKEWNPVFNRVENAIIASNSQAVDAARMKCAVLGVDCSVVATGLKGEAAEVGRRLAREAMSVRDEKLRRRQQPAPTCLISGGETTVTVKGDGVGGRNMELALAFALAVQGVPGITLLSAGTDGTDGPTDAAGAFADGQSVVKAMAAGLRAETYLENNDSRNFFARTDSLLITGPTGTNVMDLQFILVDKE
jgi:glycerate 2-kinase